jgi:sterol desaturase/sphingolipid hydroxylase (fatty acid hydroxylase superfamily)
MPEFLTAPFLDLWATFTGGSDRWFVGYLATALIAAWLIYRYHAKRDPELAEHGFIPFAFPKDIWNHSGTRVDILYFLLNKLLFTGVFASATVISYGTASALGEFFTALGLQPGLFGNTPALLIIGISTVVTLLAFDFSLYLQHWLFHRVPLLWEFHKVHHSAEVMTPFTAGRMHPVETMAGYAMSGVFNGASYTLMILLFDEAMVLNIVEINIGLFAFYILGFHLRHSHVWMPYTGIWGMIFVSPAHHQLHHSIERAHWDMNMGFIFAFWDRLFGTLVVPKREMKITFGVNGVEEGDYDTVWKLYWVPFVKAWGLLRGTRVSMDPLDKKPDVKTMQPAE